MKKTTRMLLMSDRSEPRRDGGRRDYMPKGNYPEWMPWYGEEPDMRGKERMPRRWDEPYQGYMGFGDRDEPESRGRRRDRYGRYTKAAMGGHDDEWDDEELEEHKGHGRVMSMPHKLDEHTAHEWMESLQNEDGSKGPHWTMDQVKQVLTQKNIKLDPLQAWVALNVMYSDYYAVAKKLNVNNVDFYLFMAQAFLEDKDADEDKLYSYYKHIVK